MCPVIVCKVMFIITTVYLGVFQFNVVTFANTKKNLVSAATCLLTLKLYLSLKTVLPNMPHIRIS